MLDVIDKRVDLVDTFTIRLYLRNFSLFPTLLRCFKCAHISEKKGFVPTPPGRGILVGRIQPMHSNRVFAPSPFHASIGAEQAWHSGRMAVPPKTKPATTGLGRLTK